MDGPGSARGQFDPLRYVLHAVNSSSIFEAVERAMDVIARGWWYLDNDHRPQPTIHNDNGWSRQKTLFFI